MPTRSLAMPSTTPALRRFNRSGAQRLINCPSSAKPRRQRVVADAASSTRFRPCHQLAVDLDERDVASVGALLFRRGPAAIGRLVVAAGIVALNRHALGPLAHVGQKCVKARCPAFAYRDASGAVVLVADVGGVAASPHHAAPRLINGVGLVPLSTSSVTCDQLFFAQAPATEGLAEAQAAPASHHLCTAVAAAVPGGRCRFAVVAGIGDNGQAPKALTLQVGSGVAHGKQ